MKACNGCIGCCLTLAIREHGTRSFHACRHVKAPPAYPTGCGIYQDRPSSCALWRCRWLLAEDWPEALRPDRCGIVFETVSEMIRVNGADLPVVEAYVIPGQDEEAFENNPEVRAAIVSILADGYGVLWRMQGDKGPGGPERVRVMVNTPHGIGVGPITDTIEPPVPFDEYSATGNREARRDKAERLARAQRSRR